jgi:NADPH:quinone reductase-like Zn-dependent oxidoreductase
MLFDVIGGEIVDRSAALVRAGGTLVTIVRVPTVRPMNGRAIFFVLEPDRSRLADLVQRLRDGPLKPIVRAVRPLAEAPAAFAPEPRRRSCHRTRRTLIGRAAVSRRPPRGAMVAGGVRRARAPTAT